MPGLHQRTLSGDVPMKLKENYVYQQKTSSECFVLVTAVGKKELSETDYNANMLYLTGESKGANVGVKTHVSEAVYTLLGSIEDYPEYLL